MMKESRYNELQVQTPEGSSFSLLLASPVSRFLAWVFDLFVILVLISSALTLMGFLQVISADMARASGIIAYFVISVGYGIAAEWYGRGQTVGKRIMRLRVMDEQGLRMHFSQIAIRNLLRFIDIFPVFYLVGGVSCLISRRSQRLGDIAANTVVIRNPRIDEPDIEQLVAGKFNSFRSHPHLEARLRQVVTPEEAGIAFQAVLRRDEFESIARIRLFQTLAAHFKQRVGFPAETVDGLSDERYIRNLVDTLYRKIEPKLGN